MAEPVFGLFVRQVVAEIVHQLTVQALGLWRRLAVELHILAFGPVAASQLFELLLCAVGHRNHVVVGSLFADQPAFGLVSNDVDVLLVDVLFAEDLAAILIGGDTGHDSFGGERDIVGLRRAGLRWRTLSERGSAVSRHPNRRTTGMRGSPWCGYVSFPGEVPAASITGSGSDWCSAWRRSPPLGVSILVIVLSLSSLCLIRMRTRILSASVTLLFGTALGLGLCLGSTPSFAAEPPWLEVHSAHFTVITDAGEKRGREAALRFEQMRSVFAILLSKDRLNQPLPLTILAFKNDKTYYQTAPLNQGQPIALPGFFVPGEDQNFIVLNLFEEEPWRAVSHEFCHMLLNANYPPAQGWFDEGLCEYFSSIRVDNRQVEIGGDPELQPSVKQDLLQNTVATNPPKSLTELLGAQVWLAMTDLFTMKHDTSTYNEGTHHTLYYAQSWMVMHYLLHEKKLAETGAYFDLGLNQHVPVEDAIQKAYGMSSVQFEQAVKDYFHAQAPLLLALDAARSSDPNATKTTAQDYHF